MKWLSFLVLFIAACSAPNVELSNSLVSSQGVLAPTYGRFNLIGLPKSYTNHVARAEKFFTLIQNDFSVGNVKFIGTHQSPDNIISTIKASEDYTTPVTTYGNWLIDKRSVVIAYYNGKGIYLNKYKLNRNACDVINTLVHEYMHRLGYSHGTNGVKGQARDYSVPYWFGNKAEEYCRKGAI